MRIRHRFLKRRDKSWGALAAVIAISLASMAIGLYLWIEFVKFCVWAGQWTWP